MRERIQPILRLVCLALAAALVYQIAQSAFRGNPTSHLSIPQLPKLASDTNSPSARPADGKGTNNLAKVETNQPPTNAVAGTTNVIGTNSVAAVEADKTDTNAIASTKPAKGTNAVASHKPIYRMTNSVAGGDAKVAGTNSIASTNGDAKIAGTNAAVSSNTVATATNAGPRSRSAGHRAGGPGGMPPGMPGMMAGGGGPPLPAPIRARVDRIVESEILGMVMHPVPMGLLGIAGNSAFLRAPSGQTGLVKEGDELGGIKLIRIGINRVLVEEAGESKELTLFSGLGGQSLLPTQKGNPNEPNH